MKSMAVLLTCHNRRTKTVACLKSLHKCNIPKHISINVYLVDDGSTDGTADAVNTLFSQVNIIKGNGNLFWNRGMHLAWSKASKEDYDYYLWLNDDTILRSSAIIKLITDSRTKSNKSIICGVCVSKKTNELTYGGYEKITHEIIKPNGHPQPCYFFNGNIVLVPKHVFKIIGNLDPIFHHGYGDYDYGLRALKKNIYSFVSSEIIGYCEKNELPVWCNSAYPFKLRLINFYTPLGISPFQHFIFAYRHWGKMKAIKTFFSQHLRLIYPSLWYENY